MHNELRGFSQRFVMVDAPAKKVNPETLRNILSRLRLARSVADAVQAMSVMLHYHKGRYINNF